ncbi:MAG: tetratricopeptide repeat protein, partial [Deltaproteobacteria bacterium]|nr:tetratricopeptide repeat protein [Deltaproteobacteria bacterium]
VLLFGDGLLSLLPGGDGPVNRQRSDDREKKAAYTRGSLEYPTREEYERRAETLEKEIELGKGSRTELEEELLWLLAWYHMTMPGAFPEGSPRTARLAALRKQHAGEGTVFADKLMAMDFVAEERWSQARTAYERYLKLRNSRLDELLSTGKLNPAMVQEDVLLQAWILCELKETGRASELLRGFLEKQPGSLLGLFLDARIRYRAGELALAEAALGKVLDRYPTHATSKALLAEVEIEQGKHGEAAEHARALVEAAVQQKDEALEMQAYRIMVRALHLQGEAGRPQLQEVLEGVVKKRSNAEEMVVALARIYLEADDAEKALTTLSLCKECRGSEFRLLQVRSMYRNDMMERALQTAQEVLEQDKDNIELLIVMAEISEKTGRHNSAMDYLRDVLRLRPDLLDASLRLARLYLSLQQPPNAREVLLEAEKYHAEDLQLEQMLAQINLEMNDDSGAAAALRKLHRMKPEDTEIRLRLVEILIRLGNYKEAVPHFDALAEKNLISTRLRPGYAMSLREVGRMDDAVEMLKAVLRDDPSDYQTARNLATIFLDKKDFFKAREYLEMARRSRSNEAEVHFLIGTCCVETGDLECAVEAFTQAVELEKQNLLYRTEYAKIIYRLAQSDEQRRDSLELMARSQFDQIIQRYETDPSIPAGRKDPDIYANRGRIWFRMGYYDKALADFRVAVAMDQLRADLLLNMGDSLFHVNKREDAKNYYREVLESGQNLAHANFYLGKIFMVEGNPKKAKAYF